jgi:hypothetical protein
VTRLILPTKKEKIVFALSRERVSVCMYVFIFYFIIFLLGAILANILQGCTVPGKGRKPPNLHQGFACQD